MPDKAVEEARSSWLAIKILSFSKQQNQKVVVSLSPASVKKEGSCFDLAIALGYLLSDGELNFNPEGKIFIGELALDRTLRPVKGVLSLVKVQKNLGFKEIFVPESNAKEAGLIDGINIFLLNL